MSRAYNAITVAILNYLAGKQQASPTEIKNACAKAKSSKDFYNYLFRLEQQELVAKSAAGVKITADGKKLLDRLAPQTGGGWKLVIFDIPEKHKYVRVVLRAKLKQLHFKKWQNSIWASPFKMDEEIESELNELGKKFFVRLVKVSSINHIDDLEQMFK